MRDFGFIITAFAAVLFLVAAGLRFYGSGWGHGVGDLGVDFVWDVGLGALFAAGAVKIWPKKNKPG